MLIVAALVLAAPVSATEADLELLRDVICRIETQHLPPEQAEDAVGEAGELGVCQVLPSTAKEAGYQGNNRGLLTWHANRRVALEVLRKCQGEREFNAHRISYCYHGGVNRRYRNHNVWWGYANRAALAFEMAKARMRGLRDGG